MSTIYSKNNKFENIDTVFFDKDGTFIDSHVYWGELIERRIKAAIEFYDIKIDCFDELCLSLGYDRCAKKLVEAGPIALLPREDIVFSLTQKLGKFGIQSTKDDISTIFNDVHLNFQEDMFDYVKLLDGAVELFKRLKNKGLKLAVVTSDSHINAVKIVDYLNLNQYFDLIIGKDDCDEPKRTGKPALVALEKINSKREQTIAVGDAPMDSDMARMAGLNGSILVATGQIPLERLKLHSDFSIKSLLELSVE